MNLVNTSFIFVAPHVGAWIETLFDVDLLLRKVGSHPMWVRGLKQRYINKDSVIGKSHPMWVRGLKQTVFDFKLTNHRRTPCGCVD